MARWSKRRWAYILIGITLLLLSIFIRSLIPGILAGLVLVLQLRALYI